MKHTNTFTEIFSAFMYPANTKKVTYMCVCQIVFKLYSVHVYNKKRHPFHKELKEIKLNWFINPKAHHSSGSMVMCDATFCRSTVQTVGGSFALKRHESKGLHYVMPRRI